MIVKGNVFNADYTRESEEDTLTIKIQKGKGNSLFYSQKRAETNSTEKTFFKRLKSPKCSVCDIKGHTFFDYWYLFKCKRPKKFKAVDTYIKKMFIKIQHDKDLAAQMKQFKFKKLNADKA